MHIPVLLNEVISALQLEEGKGVVDATCGFGGHGEAIVKAIGPTGHYLGLDTDPDAAAAAAKRLAPYACAKVVHASYRQMRQVAAEYDIKSADAVLFDLGFSSWQIDASGRGFSFRQDEPLDMRFDPAQAETAADLLAKLSHGELARIFREYSDESRAGRLAAAILEARKLWPIKTTSDLRKIIEGVKGSRLERGLHPATKAFQALRIAVNKEFESIERGLSEAVELLTLGGRLVVISFHSGEDRLVKNYFRREVKGCICPPESPVCQCGQKPRLKILTKKPIHATDEEIIKNPRARSAIMRVAERI